MSSNPPPPKSTEVSMASVFTTALWMSCVAIGLIGVVIPYARPVAAKPIQAPIEAQLLNVQLTADPVPRFDQAPPKAPDILTPPPASEPPPVPAAPPLVAVAAPTAPVAFQLPVAGPVQVVEASAAAFSAPANQTEAAAEPAVVPLTFGSGEGRQAQPEYPVRAKREGQEGLVRVVFTVGADGRPLAAELSRPSRWPLLNESALRAIRDKWRFAPGPLRRYEVPIHFSLRK